MLSGMEQKTKQMCPDKGNVSMRYLNVRGVFLPDSVGLTVAAGTLQVGRGKVTLVFWPSGG